jgi:hypothetical protein
MSKTADHQLLLEEGPMAPPISALLPVQVAQESAAPAAGQAQQAGKRSFESVLNDAGRRPEAGSGPPAADPATPKVSGAQLEQLRLELTERTNHLRHNGKALDAMLPDLADGKTRRTLMQQAVRGLTNEAFTKGDFKGLLGQIEERWWNVERIMGSSQPLSSGDMLALQARLYQVTQHVEVMSKVVDQVTGGIKTILNTNV